MTVGHMLFVLRNLGSSDDAANGLHKRTASKKAFVLQALESSLAYFLQSSWNDLRAYAAMNTAPSSGVCKSFLSFVLRTSFRACKI